MGGLVSKGSKKVGEKLTKGALKALEEAGIDLNPLVDNLGKIDVDTLNSLAGKAEKINFDSLSQIIEKINQIDIAKAGNKINEILANVEPDKVKSLINNLTGATKVLAEKGSAIANSLIATPFVLGVNCLISLGTLITGAMTVNELKKVNQKLTEVNINLKEMKSQLVIQNIISQKICDAMWENNRLTGYDGQEAIKIKDKNKLDIKKSYNKARYREAIIYSNQFLTSQDPKVFYYRGLSLYELGLYFAAAQNFTKAKKINPTNPNYLYWRGLTFLHLGLTESAKQDFNEVYLIRPNWPHLDAHLDLAQDNAADAKEKYEQLIDAEEIAKTFKTEIKPYDLHYLLAMCNFLLAQQDEVQTAFESARELANNNLDKLNELISIEEKFVDHFNPASDKEKKLISDIIITDLASNEIKLADTNTVNHALLLGNLKESVDTNNNMNEIYLLAELCLKIGALIDGMGYCKRAADLGHQQAQIKIIECHKIMDGDKIFGGFVNWDFVKNTIALSFSAELTEQEKNQSLAKFHAAIILFRGLFNYDKDLDRARSYLNEIKSDNLLAKTQLGYYESYIEKNNETAKSYFEAALKLPIANYYLAYIFKESIPKKSQEACQHYREAFEKGIKIADIDFAKMFYHGIETSADHSFASTLFETLSTVNLQARFYQATRRYHAALFTSKEKKVRAKERLEASKNFTATITALSGIFKQQKTLQIDQEKEKTNVSDFSLNKASLACNKNFAIQVYQSGKSVSYRLGSIKDKVKWLAAVALIDDAKNPAVALDDHNRICITFQNYDNQFYYLTGQLKDDGMLHWSDKINFNIDAKQLTGSFVTMDFLDGTVLMTYIIDNKIKYRMGKFKNDGTLHWGKDQNKGFDYDPWVPILRNLHGLHGRPDFKLCAIGICRWFETKIAILLSNSSDGDIAYEIGWINSVEDCIVWKDNYRSEFAPFKGFNPTLSARKDNIAIVFAENQNQPSLLRWITAEIFPRDLRKLDTKLQKEREQISKKPLKPGKYDNRYFEIEKKRHIEITNSLLELRWDEKPRKYNLGAFPIAALIGRDILELHEENNELTSCQIKNIF